MLVIKDLTKTYSSGVRALRGVRLYCLALAAVLLALAHLVFERKSK